MRSDTTPSSKSTHVGKSMRVGPSRATGLQFLAKAQTDRLKWDISESYSELFTTALGATRGARMVIDLYEAGMVLGRAYMKSIKLDKLSSAKVDNEVSLDIGSREFIISIFVDPRTK
ncbi:hypothetical protein K3495_g6455 [Podosphaera aphanis]|nr:hypothetical protein K3495_g6455 [Podosphaera aphanis]